MFLMQYKLSLKLNSNPTQVYVSLNNMNSFCFNLHQGTN